MGQAQKMNNTHLQWILPWAVRMAPRCRWQFHSPLQYNIHWDWLPHPSHPSPSAVWTAHSVPPPRDQCKDSMNSFAIAWTYQARNSKNINSTNPFLFFFSFLLPSSQDFDLMSIILFNQSQHFIFIGPCHFLARSSFTSFSEFCCSQ